MTLHRAISGAKLDREEVNRGNEEEKYDTVNHGCIIKS